MVIFGYYKVLFPLKEMACFVFFLLCPLVCPLVGVQTKGHGVYFYLGPYKYHLGIIYLFRICFHSCQYPHHTTVHIVSSAEVLTFSPRKKSQGKDCR